MAISVIANWNSPVYQKRTFLCDYKSDIDNLPNQSTHSNDFPNGVPAGSEALCTENALKYILNNAGVWKVKTAYGSGVQDVQKSDGTSVVSDGIAILPDDLQGVTDVQKSDGTSVVTNGVAVLPDDLQGVTDVKVGGTSVVSDGVANLGMITSEDGAFGLRFYNGVLQYKSGENWVTISIANQTI